VIEHLPEAERARAGRKLDAILADTNPDRGEQATRDLAKALERKHPGAAASLREGLPELFTVARLGITGTLAKTLISSNPIESMFSIARRVNRNVTRWRDGAMVMRQAAAGMKQAAAQFRRVRGYRQMPALIAALDETTQTEHTDKPAKRLRAA
jgi:putative transposase